MEVVGNKLFYGIVIGLVALFIGAFIYMSSTEDKEGVSLAEKYYTDKEYEDLSAPTKDSLGKEQYSFNVPYTKSKELIESGEEVVVYYWSPTCVYCIEESPKVYEVVSEKLKEDKDFKFLQVNILEYPEVADDDSVGLVGTPQLVKYSKGIKVSELIGANSGEDGKDLSTYKKFLDGEFDDNSEGIEVGKEDSEDEKKGKSKD